jgi:hypothetical protein
MIRFSLMYKNKLANKLRTAFFAGTICCSTAAGSYAQEQEARPPEAPLPGAQSAPADAAATQALQSGGLPPAAPGLNSQPVQEAGASAPVPGSQNPQTVARLTSVISVHDAETWIERFKNQATNPSPRLLDQLATFYEWLLELLDEHNRLAVTFAKNESTKPLSASEKQTVEKFTHLKNEVLLLKASLLIKLNRYAEAIMPLVDVINAEPMSPAGKQAYKDLQDIGFSEIPDFTRQLIENSDTSAKAAAASNAEPAKMLPVKTVVIKPNLAAAKTKTAKRYGTH